MKNLILLIGFSILFYVSAIAQEIELYSSNSNAKIELIADKATSGAEATIMMRRTDNNGKSLVRYDLQPIEQMGQTTIQGEESWDVGIRLGERFKISHFLSVEDAFGGAEVTTTDAIVIDKGDGDEDPFQVRITQGNLRIGGDMVLKSESTGLKLSGGDLLPDRGNYGTNLGGPTLEEAWYNLYTSDVVYVRPSPLSAKSNWKKSNYGLKQILSIDSWSVSNNKSSESYLYLDPNDISKVLPQAISYGNSKGQTSSSNKKTIVGLKYDQFIPVLIKAIQDQQDMIQSMQLQIEALK